MPENKKVMVINIETILGILAKEIYDSPLASLRENLQNAVDAIRVREKKSGNFKPNIQIIINKDSLQISDNGNGMSEDELHQYYWAVGKSGKAAFQDICIGTFGIGALANFGIAKDLEVISRPSTSNKWARSYLSMDNIKTPDGSPPKIEYSNAVDYTNNDIGTTVKISLKSPMSKVDISNAETYIKSHVEGLNIPVKVNGSNISGGNWFVIPSGYIQKEKGKEELAILNKKVEIEYIIYENQAGKLAVQFNSEFLSGLALPEKRPSTVFKRTFKLCDYQPYSPSTIQFHLLVDCWYFTPTAGRDTLSSESAREFSSLISRIESILLRAAAKSNLRIRSLIGMFIKILNSSYSFDLDRLDNLVVRQVMGDDVSLKSIKSLADGKTKAVFYTTQDSRSAQALVGRGHIVILLPSDYVEQGCISKYLINKYQAKDLKQFDAVEQLISMNELSQNEQAVITTLRHDLAESLESPDLQIVPAHLTEGLMFYWPPNPMDDNKNTIYCDIKHHHIVAALSQKRGWQPKILMDLLMNDIGEQVYRYKRQTLGKNEAGIEALLQNRYKMYQLSLQDVQRISKRNSITISTNDVQRVNTAASDKTDDKPTKKIVYLDSPVNVWGGKGCYLQLDALGHTTAKPIKDLCQGIELWWSGPVINYYLQYGNSSLFMISLEADELIKISNEINGELKESRNPLFLDEYTYIPVPFELEKYIVPTEEIQITKLYIRSRMFNQ